MSIARWTGAALLLAAVAQAHGAAAGELVVRVEGVRGAEGVVRLALYDEPAEFPRGHRCGGGKVPAADGAIEHVFTGLAPGRYAVAAYHDADDDNDFDQGLFGIPLEGYGFSNGASAGIGGPPAFDEAVVTVDGARTVVTVELRYW